VGECFFWCGPTRVVPDQRPLNGRCCCLLYRLTRAVLEKGLLNGCVCVCVCVRVCKMILASFVEPVVVVVVHRSCHTKVADLDRLSRVNETVATRQITTEYSSVVFTLILQWHSITAP